MLLTAIALCLSTYFIPFKILTEVFPFIKLLENIKKEVQDLSSSNHIKFNANLQNGNSRIITEIVRNSKAIGSAMGHPGF